MQLQLIAAQVGSTHNKALNAGFNYICRKKMRKESRRRRIYTVLCLKERMPLRTQRSGNMVSRSKYTHLKYLSFVNLSMSLSLTFTHRRLTHIGLLYVITYTRFSARTDWAGKPNLRNSGLGNPQPGNNPTFDRGERPNPGEYPEFLRYAYISNVLVSFFYFKPASFCVLSKYPFPHDLYQS